MGHWLIHLLGIDTQQSMPYDFWSGAGTQLAPLAAVAVWAWRHHCHGGRCPRIGRHVHAGTHYCARHHPGRDGSGTTVPTCQGCSPAGEQEAA